MRIYPETTYQVEVLETIKGEQSSSTTVTQYGGFEGNVLVLLEEDELLIEGNTYLLATINQEERTHFIIPVGGSIEMNGLEEQTDYLEAYRQIVEEQQ